MKNRLAIPILATWVTVFFGFKTSHDVDSYVKRIDNLLKEKQLQMKRFPERSSCGGGVKGYFLNNELVYINSGLFVADYSGKTRVYFRADSIVKIEMRELFPINDSTRTDSTFVMVFGESINKYTLDGKGNRLNFLSDSRSKRLIDCAKNMKNEILSIK